MVSKDREVPGSAWSALARCAAPLLIALPLLNCGGRPHAADEKYWLVATNIKLPYWQTANAGLVAAARQLGVLAEMVGPDTYDPQAQRDEFRRVVARKPAGIMVSPADPELMTPEINAAIAQGIPVITMDSDAPASRRLLFVGTNNYQAGVMGAQVVARGLKGKGSVVIYTISGQENLKERLRGYQAVLAEHPQIRIREIVDVRGDPRVAFDRTKEIVAGKDLPDAFACLEAIACAEVADVLDRNRIGGKLVVAMDTQEMTLEWIRKGMIAATVAQKPYTMAFYGLKVLDDLHHHKPASLEGDWARNIFAPFPMVVDTGVTLVDKGNVEEFLRAQPPMPRKGG
ncbi:MAG: substrate-binding domain-containing protein [Bryobacterales bacterium]|nr:substrate-binding domain-containing protein [Bryobacterales bacterium]